MGRPEFLQLADQLHDFILDSIEEFATGAGLEFDRKAFLRDSGTDFPQLAVEALIYGAGAYDVVEDQAEAAAA